MISAQFGAISVVSYLFPSLLTKGYADLIKVRYRVDLINDLDDWALLIWPCWSQSPFPERPCYDHPTSVESFKIQNTTAKITSKPSVDLEKPELASKFLRKLLGWLSVHKQRPEWLRAREIWFEPWLCPALPVWTYALTRLGLWFSYITCAATLQIQMKCSVNGSNESFWVLICKNRGKMIISHIVQFSVFDTPKGFYKHYFSFCNKGCVLSLSFFFFFFLFAHCMACGILVPWPGVKPLSPALESQSLNHWTVREVHFFLWCLCLILRSRSFYSI